ncbi:MAG: universal stress protein [Methyloligellaceae bacterium]
MYKKILISIDYAEESSWRKALPLAVEEARLHQAELSAVTVVPEVVKLPNLPEGYGEGAAEHVRETVQALFKDQGYDISLNVRQGSVYREILKEAHAINADLIIIASAKGDFPDYPLGPNAARVVRHANCSVQVVRG